MVKAQATGDQASSRISTNSAEVKKINSTPIDREYFDTNSYVMGQAKAYGLNKKIEQDTKIVQKSTATVAAGNKILYTEQSNADRKAANSALGKAVSAQKSLEKQLPTGVKMNNGVLTPAQLSKLNPNQIKAYNNFVKAATSTNEAFSRVTASDAMVGKSNAQLQVAMHQKQKTGTAGSQGIAEINKALKSQNLRLASPKKVSKTKAETNLKQATKSSEMASAQWNSASSLTKTLGEGEKVQKAQIRYEKAKTAVSAREKATGQCEINTPQTRELDAAKKGLEAATAKYGSSTPVLLNAKNNAYVSKLADRDGVDTANKNVTDLTAKSTAWAKANPNAKAANPFAKQLATAKEQLTASKQKADVSDSTFVAAYANHLSGTMTKPDKVTSVATLQLNQNADVKLTGYVKTIIGNDVTKAEQNLEAAKATKSTSVIASAQAELNRAKTALSSATVAEVDAKIARSSTDYLLSLPGNLQNPQSAADRNELATKMGEYRTSQLRAAAGADISIAKSIVNQDDKKQEEKLDNRGWMQSLSDVVVEGSGGDRSRLETYINDKQGALDSLEKQRGTMSSTQFQGQLDKIMGGYNSTYSAMAAGEKKTDERWATADSWAKEGTAVIVGIAVTAVTFNPLAGAAAGFGTRQAWETANDATVMLKGGNVAADGHVSLLTLGSQAGAVAILGNRATPELKAQLAANARIAAVDATTDVISSVTTSYGMVAGGIGGKAMASGVTQALEKKVLGGAISAKAASTTARVAGTSVNMGVSQGVMGAGAVANTAIYLGADGQLNTKQGRETLIKAAQSQAVYTAGGMVMGGAAGKLTGNGIKVNLAREGISAVGTVAQEELRARLVDGRSATKTELILAAGSSLQGTALMLASRSGIEKSAERPLASGVKSAASTAAGTPHLGPPATAPKIKITLRPVSTAASKGAKPNTPSKGAKANGVAKGAKGTATANPRQSTPTRPGAGSHRPVYGNSLSAAFNDPFNPPAQTRIPETFLRKPTLPPRLQPQRSLSVQEVVTLYKMRGIDLFAAKRGIENAARVLGDAQRVMLITGFNVDKGKPETDGPPGTALLGRALRRTGKEVTYVTSKENVPVLEAALRAIGEVDKNGNLIPKIISFEQPHGNKAVVKQAKTAAKEAKTAARLAKQAKEAGGTEAAKASATAKQAKAKAKKAKAAAKEANAAVKEANRLLKEYKPDAVVAIELPARSKDGEYRNMRGASVKETEPDKNGKRETINPPLDEIMIQANKRSSIATIGVGDGGNEAGMGHKKMVQFIPLAKNGMPMASAVPAKFPVTASASNWGAEALAGVLLRNLGRLDLMHTAEEGSATRHAAAKAGAVDGVSRRQESSVDGFSDYAHKGWHKLLMHSLEQPQPPVVFLGVMDSSNGGLLAAANLAKDIRQKTGAVVHRVVFVDHKNAPYGVKSQADIAKYTNAVLRVAGEAMKNTSSQAVIAMACNTACTPGTPIISQGVQAPVINLIDTTARGISRDGGAVAAELLRNGDDLSKTMLADGGIKPVSLSTTATAESNAYVNAVHEISGGEINVLQIGASSKDPNFDLATLVNKRLDLSNKPEDVRIVRDAVARYIADVPVDATSVWLTCTHYPALKEQIRQALDDRGLQHVRVIDPMSYQADAAIKAIGLTVLDPAEQGKTTPISTPAPVVVTSSAEPATVRRAARQFMGREDVRMVHVDDFADISPEKLAEIRNEVFRPNLPSDGPHHSTGNPIRRDGEIIGWFKETPEVAKADFLRTQERDANMGGAAATATEVYLAMLGGAPFSHFIAPKNDGNNPPPSVGGTSPKPKGPSDKPDNGGAATPRSAAGKPDDPSAAGGAGKPPLPPSKPPGSSNSPDDAPTPKGKWSFSEAAKAKAVHYLPWIGLNASLAATVPPRALILGNGAGFVIRGLNMLGPAFAPARFGADMTLGRVQRTINALTFAMNGSFHASTFVNGMGVPYNQMYAVSDHIGVAQNGGEARKGQGYIPNKFEKYANLAALNGGNVSLMAIYAIPTGAGAWMPGIAFGGGIAYLTGKAIKADVKAARAERRAANGEQGTASDAGAKHAKPKRLTDTQIATGAVGIGLFTFGADFLKRKLATEDKSDKTDEKTDKTQVPSPSMGPTTSPSTAPTPMPTLTPIPSLPPTWTSLPPAVQPAV